MSLSIASSNVFTRIIQLLLALALSLALVACSTDSSVLNSDGIITEDPDGVPDPGDGEGTDPTVSVINFVDASETNLVLNGIAGADQSIVTFTLRGDSSNPVVGETVNFTLSNSVGGVNLGSSSAVSDESGNVSVVVNSGTAPTIVKVTASSGSISVDSDDISISTGAAVPSAFSLAVTRFNPRGLNFDGTLVIVTARASDQAGNPVPDGTLINFRTEGGQIESSCPTAGGACQVDWFSANPRPLNGRATIFANMGGAEDFIDTNGNFVFDAGTDEGGPTLLEPFTDDNPANGSYDLGEDFIDWNSTGVRDSADLGEPYADYNENGMFDAGIDEFVDFNNNGDQDGAGDGAWTEQVAIGRSLVIVMAGDTAELANDLITAPNSTEGSAPIGGTLTYETDTIDTLSATIQDVNGNSLPTGTNIRWTSTVGSVNNAFPDNIFDNQVLPTVANVDFNAGSNLLSGQLRLEVQVPGIAEQFFTWNLQVVAPAP
ncbi:MAG: Ig-like domain-containing protein [Gammaproteobacteria bacterium]|nr:Ig-like domain-containing protein [Gammaproteobacteria bacterium]